MKFKKFKLAQSSSTRLQATYTSKLIAGLILSLLFLAVEWLLSLGERSAPEGLKFLLIPLTLLLVVVFLAALKEAFDRPSVMGPYLAADLTEKVTAALGSKCEVFVIPGRAAHTNGQLQIVLPWHPDNMPSLWAALAHEVGHVKSRRLHADFIVQTVMTTVAFPLATLLGPSLTGYALAGVTVSLLWVGINWAAEIRADLTGIRLARQVNWVSEEQLILRRELSDSKWGLTHPPNFLRVWFMKLF